MFFDLVELIEKDWMLKSMPSFRLIFHLLQEFFNPHSLWKEYIQMLPRDFSLPMLYTVEEIGELHGLTVMHDCIRDIFSGLLQFFHLRRLLKLDPIFPCEELTLARFEWARAVVLTRQNPIQSYVNNELSFQLALIPLYDMFNHSDGDITGTFDVALQTAQLFSKDSTEPGSQIFMSYGKRSNQDLFMFCGFIGNTTEFDCPKVFVALSKNDPHYNDRERLAHRFLLRSSGYYKLCRDVLKKPNDLLNILILMHLTLPELKHAHANADYTLGANTASSETISKSTKWLATKVKVQKMTCSKRPSSPNEMINKLSRMELLFWVEMENLLK
jgi:protein-histidine N-methyltransferase